MQRTSDDLSDQDKLSIYVRMLRIRLVEETIAERYHEQKMRCPVHLSIGQEATAVGACAGLSREDMIVSTHRSHGHYLAKGGSLVALLGEIHGRSIGCCGGRGGSMHLFDNKVGVLSSLPIVGSSIPVGVGAALAFQQEKSQRVSMIFLGDGATEEGVFHESMNFASVHKLPAIFFVENNLFSVYTGLSDRQPDRSMALYGNAHSVENFSVDGNDVLLIFDTVAQMVDKARNGAGPSLVIADTYRWREHCGPNFDNDLGYRSVSEHEKWVRLCPINRFESTLCEQGILTINEKNNIRSEIQSEIDLAFEVAEASPFPESNTVAENVYA